ncbi:wall-associated receptor kinase-like 20 [Abrus precatorius]|uniref:Wall-associated receptor kinase-like 20 n=1 Tax=Abrus precatorius TaxID=3816 RepID=A0A8B8L512_ABRPR|nr:wall-associated receptor kinase-like 20 [Abrus precatorius]
MRIINLSLLVFTVTTMLPLSFSINAFKRCPNCGQAQVPYPLSTAANCGDQSYKIRCTAGTLFFDSINGSSYAITAINPTTQRFVLHPPSFLNDTCVSTDFKSEGLWLDTSSPFNITSSNTLVFLNCNQDVFTTLWNCSLSSICHKYVQDNDVAAKICGTSNRVSPICCHVKTGGSVTAYRIRVRKERCAAYVSFPNLDYSLPVSMWQPGVEIEWELPEEPLCKVNEDCLDLANSGCLPDPVTGGWRKCLCKPGFHWDPVNGICQNIKCENGRGCNRRKKKTPLTGGMALVGAATLTGGLIFALMFYLRKQRIKRETQKSIIRKARNILSADSSGKSAKIFTIKDITKATNNFSKGNLLGAGGFGEVFKGTLDDGTITAIKRAKPGNTRGIDQILNEVRILCQLNHRSLVRLLGCCVELPEPLLIYEYVPNGTLFEHLHNTNSGKWIRLGWHSRLRIAHQTAEGVAYLHNASIPRIFHRDIKSSNILLNDNLDAKVSDFGLSRLAVSEASHITTCAQGTLGYLDPEYYVNFQLTDKSDVYSFGVVLLELLTSKKAIDFNREEEDVNLVVLIKRALKEGRLMDAVDPMLKNGASRVELESMKAFGSLAVACLDDRRQNRPSMKDVADEIEYIICVVANVKVEDVEA